MPTKIRPEDRWLSLYIRARDNWTCQRCGKTFVPYKEGADNSHLKGLHNAHCFGRGKHMTRWDEDNCMALCYGCHRFIDGHRSEKEKLFREKFGDAVYDSTELSSHEEYIGWKKDAPEIAKFYKNRFEALMDERS